MHASTQIPVIPVTQNDDNGSKPASAVYCIEDFAREERDINFHASCRNSSSVQEKLRLISLINYSIFAASIVLKKQRR